MKDLKKDFEGLVEFIRCEVNEFKMDIFKTTSIEDDLGITGDEAIELIERFSKKFNVDITSFHSKLYFFPSQVFL